MDQAADPRRPGRPAISGAEKIEDVAIDLFRTKGFAETSMTEVAEACSIGRSTLFRYFPTKADLVWRAFDVHLEQLADALNTQPADTPLPEAILEATVQALNSAADVEDLWSRRYEIQQRTESQRAESALRWQRWAQVVAEFVADRLGLSPDDSLPAAIGGAVQGAYAATLRRWLDAGDFGGDPGGRMRDSLRPICDAIGPMQAQYAPAEREPKNPSADA